MQLLVVEGIRVSIHVHYYSILYRYLFLTMHAWYALFPCRPLPVFQCCMHSIYNMHNIASVNNVRKSCDGISSCAATSDYLVGTPTQFT